MDHLYPPGLIMQIKHLNIKIYCTWQLMQITFHQGLSHANCTITAKMRLDVFIHVTKSQGFVYGIWQYKGFGRIMVTSQKNQRSIYFFISGFNKWLTKSYFFFCHFLIKKVTLVKGKKIFIQSLHKSMVFLAIPVGKMFSPAAPRVWFH